MKLHEDVLFGSDQVQTIKKIYNSSTKTSIKYTNNKEKSLIRNIVKALGFSTNKSEVVYYCLQAASYGPDTRSNSLLRYLMAVDKSIVYNYTGNVGLILDYIAAGKDKGITISDQGEHVSDKGVDLYLLNKSLYNRETNDFIYSVKAIDSVINKKDEYFNIDSNDKIHVTASSPELLQLFFNNDLKDDEVIAYSDDYEVYQGNSVSAYVPCDVKYLFKNYIYSATDTILPAGVQGNTNQRTIWNYIELWSNDVEGNAVEKEQNNTKTNQRKVRQQKVKQAKEVINRQNMSDEAKQYLLQTMDDLV